VNVDGLDEEARGVDGGKDVVYATQLQTSLMCQWENDIKSKIISSERLK
jgi:hypothetical protein